jgi:hypothetical protein
LIFPGKEAKLPAKVAAPARELDVGIEIYMLTRGWLRNSSAPCAFDNGEAPPVGDLGIVSIEHCSEEQPIDLHERFPSKSGSFWC